MLAVVGIKFTSPSLDSQLTAQLGLLSVTKGHQATTTVTGIWSETVDAQRLWQRAGTGATCWWWQDHGVACGMKERSRQTFLSVTPPLLS